MMRRIILLLAVCAILPAYAADSGRPSVAGTQTLEFLAKQFALKFKATDKPVQIYEYFPAGQTPRDWLELVEFQIYPVHPEGDEPLDHAKRTAAAFKKKYAHMRFAVHSDKRSGAIMLDFFYPNSTRKERGKEFLEFNAFKFFRDGSGERTLSFHYAKNIEGPHASRPMSEVSADIRKTRDDVLPAMAKFPLFRL